MKLRWSWMLVGLGLVTVGCADDKLRHPVRIAVEMPLSSGDLIPVQVAQAARLAIEDRQGMVCTYWDVSLTERDESTPDEYISEERVDRNTRFNIRNPEVAAVIGPFASRTAVQLLPATNLAGLLVLSPTNTNPCLTLDAPDCDLPDLRPSGVRNYGRFAPPDAVQGRAQARFAASGASKRVYLTYIQDTYGLVIAGSVRSELAALGATLVGDESYDRDAVDFEAMAARIVEAAPDVVLAETFDEGGDLVLALRALGYSGKMVFADGLFGYLPDLIGTEAANGTYATTAGYAPDALTGEAAAWATRFATRFGEAPDFYVLEAYMATVLALDAMEEACAAGSLPTDRAAVTRAALSSKQRQSLVGPYTMDANGDFSAAGVALYQVVGGQYVVVK